MDRAFSVFSLYDFLSYAFVGALAISGVYWAAAGVPGEPGTATVIGVVVASYIAGHAVQAVGALWESAYWKRRGGWPSDVRMDSGSEGAFDKPFRAFIKDRLVADHGAPVRDLPTKDLFGLARADLRRSGLDTRAELMNALYALSRGLATATALLLIVFVSAWIASGETESFLPATAAALVAAGLFLLRFHRFGFFFADQVWRDYAAKSEPR